MQVSIINLPKINDQRGNLSFIENGDLLPFKIKRTYWTYDVPGGEIREGHAYKTQHEFIIALSGAFDVTIIDKNGNKSVFQLNRSYFGLYIPPMHWRVVDNFSTNAFGLHLSSTKYNEDDYIRDFNHYKQW
jgi:oxalate decarboxylase/phosphoglucose isomerase-like protein (cupin superfamily)